jgi:hypothetical protein
MSRIITCRCGQQLEISDAMLGQRLACPTCGDVLHLVASPRSYAQPVDQDLICVPSVSLSLAAQVKETPIKPGSSEDMPGEFRDAVQRILTIYDIPAAEQEALLSKVAANAAPAPAAPKKEAQR